MEKDFSALSLEYKLSNINQVKSFSKCLNKIHCFYTDRQVDFDMLEAFTPQQIERIAPLEYERWLREQTRCHKLAIDGELSKEQIISHCELPTAYA